MYFYRSAKLATCAFLLAMSALASNLSAATFDFHVTLDVSALIGAPNSPFYLEFQLNKGSTSFSNSATLSNFTFVGGGATGAPMSQFGTASGSLGSSVVLTDSTASPYNEFYQGFSTGTSSIRFDVSLTQNSPGNQADGFLATVLDSESGNPELYTNAPDTLSLVSVAISDANQLADVGTYQSIAPSPVGVSASVLAVPEPSSILALGSGACTLLCFRPRFRAGSRR